MTADDVHATAVEDQEFGDERHARSPAEAEAAVDRLVAALAGIATLVA